MCLDVHFLWACFNGTCVQAALAAADEKLRGMAGAAKSHQK